MADGTPTVKIENINITIGDKTISLSVEQARELKRALNDTFPEKAPIPFAPYCPPVIERHIYPWERQGPYWDGWKVTSGGSTVSFSTTGAG